MVSFSVNNDELAELVKEGQITFFKSRFQFLNEVNGLRPSCLTGFLSNSHTGKSTLIKSIVIDSIESCRGAVWLTEETIAQYQMKLHYINPNYNKDNLVFLDEQEDESLKTNRTPKDLAMFLYNSIVSTDSKFLIIDNITTSDLYENFKPAEQASFINLLKRMAKKLKIPIVYVAHTDSNITNSNNKFTEGENIRGSRQPFIQAAYFFIIQRFTCNGKVFTFLRIIKHRFHEPSNLYFLLEWKDYQYKRDCAVEFDKINDAYNSRDYLGKKQQKDTKPKWQGWNT